MAKINVTITDEANARGLPPGGRTRIRVRLEIDTPTDQQVIDDLAVEVTADGNAFPERDRLDAEIVDQALRRFAIQAIRQSVIDLIRP